MSINITNGAKPTKRWSSSDESIVGIEPGTGAAVIVAMFKQFIEQREADEAANTTTTTTRGWGLFGRCSYWRLTLALATIFAVLGCGATQGGSTILGALGENFKWIFFFKSKPTQIKINLLYGSINQYYYNTNELI